MIATFEISLGLEDTLEESPAGRIVRISEQGAALQSDHALGRE